MRKIDDAFAGVPLVKESIPYGTDSETKELYLKQFNLWGSYKFYTEFTKLPRDEQVANMSRFEAFEVPTAVKKGDPAIIWRRINKLHLNIKSGTKLKKKEFKKIMNAGFTKDV